MIICKRCLEVFFVVLNPFLTLKFTRLSWCFLIMNQNLSLVAEVSFTATSAFVNEGNDTEISFYLNGMIDEIAVIK